MLQLIAREWRRGCSQRNHHASVFSVEVAEVVVQDWGFYKSLSQVSVPFLLPLSMPLSPFLLFRIHCFLHYPFPSPSYSGIWQRHSLSCSTKFSEKGRLSSWRWLVAFREIWCYYLDYSIPLSFFASVASRGTVNSLNRGAYTKSGGDVGTLGGGDGGGGRGGGGGGESIFRYSVIWSINPFLGDLQKLFCVFLSYRIISTELYHAVFFTLPLLHDELILLNMLLSNWTSLSFVCLQSCHAEFRFIKEAPASTHTFVLIISLN